MPTNEINNNITTTESPGNKLVSSFKKYNTTTAPPWDTKTVRVENGKIVSTDTTTKFYGNIEQICHYWVAFQIKQYVSNHYPDKFYSSDGLRNSLDILGEIVLNDCSPNEQKNYRYYRQRLVNFILLKTNDEEDAKEFRNYCIIKCSPIYTVEDKKIDDVLNFWWTAYINNDSRVEELKKLPAPDPEAKMEAGQPTTTFQNGATGNDTTTDSSTSTSTDCTDNTKLQSELSAATVIGHKKDKVQTELGAATVTVQGKVSYLRDAWNTTNEITDYANDVNDRLLDAKIAKAQALITGAVDITQAGANILGATTNVLAAPQIALNLTNTVISETSSYIATAVKDISLAAVEETLKWPQNTLQKTTSYFSYFMSYFKLTIDDVIMTPELKVDLKAAQNEAMEKVKAQLKKTEQLNDSIAKIQGTVTRVTSKMNEIAGYIEEGPEWIEEQTNKLLYSYLAYIGWVRDKGVEGIHNMYERAANNISYRAGQRMYEKYFKKAEEVLQEQFRQLQVMQMKAQIKAKQSIAVAMSKIMAKLGL